MGMWILQKRYSTTKYVSVVLITVGIITCTLATSGLDNKKHKDVTQEEDTSSYKDYVIWLIGKIKKRFFAQCQYCYRICISFLGLTMLWFALFFSALLGIRQEQLYTKYGKHNREALFYVVRLY